MAIVLLGPLIAACKRSDVLGISDRDRVIEYVTRAVELGANKANFNPTLGELQIRTDACGYATLPYFVGTVLACNVNGQPTLMRNNWFQYHENGPGEQDGNSQWSVSGWSGAGNWGNGYGGTQVMGPGNYVDDKDWSPVFDDLTGWSALAALTENPLDGDGTRYLIVEGETQNAQGDPKEALTTSGPYAPGVGVRIPLLANLGTTDPAATLFRRITRVTIGGPPRRDYVKLLAFRPQQSQLASVVGYYAAHEISPRYRRIRVSSPCARVKIKYRVSDTRLQFDYQRVPLGSFNAALELVKSIWASDNGKPDVAAAYEAAGTRHLIENQMIEDGPNQAVIQVDPGWGVSTLDWR